MELTAVLTPMNTLLASVGRANTAAVPSRGTRAEVIGSLSAALQFRTDLAQEFRPNFIGLPKPADVRVGLLTRPTQNRFSEQRYKARHAKVRSAMDENLPTASLVHDELE